jgi:ADP-ribose pyrophosphatase
MSLKSTDKILYKGHLTLVHRPYLGKNFDVVVSKDAAVMLYIDENDFVYLTKQFRPAVDKEVLGLPAETLDKPNLSIPEIMIEGLEEECGIRIKPEQVVFNGEVYSTDGHDTEKVYLFTARGRGEIVGQNLQEDERIEVVKIKFDDAFKKVISNELKGSKTSYLIMLEKLRRLGEIK